MVLAVVQHFLCLHSPGLSVTATETVPHSHAQWPNFPTDSVFCQLSANTFITGNVIREVISALLKTRIYLQGRDGGSS